MKICSVCGRCYENSVLSCSEDDQPLPEVVKSYAREEVPNYRLETLVETTPWGDAYRASQLILKKSYRVAIIESEAAGSDAGKLLLTEARKLSAVIHSGVARIFESGSLADGSIYVVSELFEGQTLRECIENVGAPDEVTAVMIARQTAEALEAIHSSGVRHRNLRPENILLTKDLDGELQIKLQNADLGGLFEKNVQATGDLYLTALRYFSPEQCEGITGDFQSDAYALGVMLHELLDGAPPFDSPYADALIAKHLHDSPPPLKIERFDIRMLITHTLADALQKQTRLRIKTASAFARRLRHIEQLATHSSTPPPAVAHLSAKAKPQISFAKAPRNAPKPLLITETEILPELEPQTVPVAAAAFEIAEPMPEPLAGVFSEPVAVAAPVDQVEVHQVERENEVLLAAPVVETEKVIESVVALPVVEVEKANEAAFAHSAPEKVEERQISPFVTRKLKREDVFDIAYPDLSTTKLPPIETVIKKSISAPVNAVVAIESVGKVRKTVDNAGQPLLVAWEQPDDVPSVTQALGKRRKELADAAFAKAIAKFIREEDEVETKVSARSFEPMENQPVVSQASTLFRYDDSKTTWKMPGSRSIAAAAGLLVILVLSVSALVVGRGIWASNREDPLVVQPKVDSAPVSAAPDRMASIEPPLPTKPQPIVEKADVSLPDFSPREIQNKPSVTTVSQKKARTVKPVAEKTPTPALLGKIGEPDKPTGAITRPRIVKVPK